MYTIAGGAALDDVRVSSKWPVMNRPAQCFAAITAKNRYPLSALGSIEFHSVEFHQEIRDLKESNS